MPARFSGRLKLPKLKGRRRANRRYYCVSCLAVELINRGSKKLDGTDDRNWFYLHDRAHTPHRSTGKLPRTCNSMSWRPSPERKPATSGYRCGLRAEAKAEAAKALALRNQAEAYETHTHDLYSGNILDLIEHTDALARSYQQAADRHKISGRNPRTDRRGNQALQRSRPQGSRRAPPRPLSHSERRWNRQNPDDPMKPAGPI